MPSDLRSDTRIKICIGNKKIQCVLYIYFPPPKWGLKRIAFVLITFPILFLLMLFALNFTSLMWKL